MYHVHLKQFDGPLDFLLHLISRAKIDIRDIFVSEITEQYLESMREADDLDMDSASEFLTMAATLLEIKSRTLLPRQEPENDETEDLEKTLIQRLEDYKRFKEASQELSALEKAAAQMFAKLPEEYPLPPQEFELTGLTLRGLIDALSRAINRQPAPEPDLAPLRREIRRDNFTVQECMLVILKRLKPGHVTFRELVSNNAGREEVVTMFMALLELLHLGKAHVAQTRLFAPIELGKGGIA